MFFCKDQKRSSLRKFGCVIFIAWFFHVFYIKQTNFRLTRLHSLAYKFDQNLDQKRLVDAHNDIENYKTETRFRTGVPNLFLAVYQLWTYSVAAYHLPLTNSF